MNWHSMILLMAEVFRLWSEKPGLYMEARSNDFAEDVVLLNVVPEALCPTSLNMCTQ